MSGFGATGIGVDDVAEMAEGGDAAVTDDAASAVADAVVESFDDPLDDLAEQQVVAQVPDLAPYADLMTVSIGEFVTRVKGLKLLKSLDEPTHDAIVNARIEQHMRDRTVLEGLLPVGFMRHQGYSSDFFLGDDDILPRARYPRPDDGPARARYRAYAKQQAQSAFKSALGGTGVHETLNIVETVKDAVKFIANKLHDRIEKW